MVVSDTLERKSFLLEMYLEVYPSSNRLFKSRYITKYYMKKVAEGTRLAPNSLSCQRRTPREPREALRKSDAHWKISRSAEPEVISEPVDLMHALMWLPCWQACRGLPQLGTPASNLNLR